MFASTRIKGIPGRGEGASRKVGGPMALVWMGMDPNGIGRGSEGENNVGKFSLLKVIDDIIYQLSRELYI